MNRKYDHVLGCINLPSITRIVAPISPICNPVEINQKPGTNQISSECVDRLRIVIETPAKSLSEKKPEDKRHACAHVLIVYIPYSTHRTHRLHFVANGGKSIDQRRNLSCADVRTDAEAQCRCCRCGLGCGSMIADSRVASALWCWW